MRRNSWVGVIDGLEGVAADGVGPAQPSPPPRASRFMEAPGSDNHVIGGIPGVPELPAADTNVIKMAALSERIVQMSANSDLGFLEEYEVVESGKQYTRLVSNMPCHMHKNRYANILAYDHSRVRLQVLDADDLTGLWSCGLYRVAI